MAQFSSILESWHPREWSVLTIIGVVSAACVLHFISAVIYRLYFSPLAKFPGPKLAAASAWYEFYFDYWLNGKYIFEIERMHQKYGKLCSIWVCPISIDRRANKED